jgi:hypothetical protein
MANLTLRQIKGSPLTIAEMDGNFEYFTGSHAITGSLTVSGSIIPAEVNGTLGTAAKPWKELFIDGATIVFISGSSSGSINFTSGSEFNFTGGGLTISGSPVITSNLTGSNATTGSNSFTGSQTISGSLTTTGSVNITGSININGSTVITSNLTGSNATTGSNSFTGSQTISGSLTTTGSVNITGSININGSTVITSNQTGSFAPTGSTPTTGSNTFNGSQTISGSLLISGSIIPNVGSGSTTSSFNLGSPTNAWKDIYVSDGTINFLDGAGNVQGTIGTGTNATVITGSLNVVPINPLTSYTFINGTLLHKSYTTSDCAFSLYNSGTAGLNPAIYWRNVLDDGTSLVLPWDKKIAAYSLANNIPASNTTVSTVISLPPIMNAGYSTGDQITVYNLGKNHPIYKSSGSIFIVGDMMGVTNVDSNTKQITGTQNNSFILSGSWGNYTQINIVSPATTSSIEINPGQKATFEIVYWGTISSTPSASMTGFSSNQYETNFTNSNPSSTYTRYLFKGIENL